MASIDPPAGKLPGESHHEDISNRVIRGTYYPHIDGLRSLAVVPVVLYHLLMKLCPAGFMGVDIFFVISGYLICGGIVRDLQAGTFSIASFYQRRIRRIFPAYFVLVSGVLVIGITLYHWARIVPLAQNGSLQRALLHQYLFLVGHGIFPAECAWQSPPESLVVGGGRAVLSLHSAAFFAVVENPPQGADLRLFDRVALIAGVMSLSGTSRRFDHRLLPASDAGLGVFGGRNARARSPSRRFMALPSTRWQGFIFGYPCGHLPMGRVPVPLIGLPRIRIFMTSILSADGCRSFVWRRGFPGFGRRAPSRR